MRKKHLLLFHGGKLNIRFPPLFQLPRKSEKYNIIVEYRSNGIIYHLNCTRVRNNLNTILYYICICIVYCTNCTVMYCTELYCTNCSGTLVHQTIIQQ